MPYAILAACTEPDSIETLGPNSFKLAMQPYAGCPAPYIHKLPLVSHTYIKNGAQSHSDGLTRHILHSKEI